MIDLRTIKLEDINRDNAPQVIEAITSEPTWNDAAKELMLSIVEGQVYCNTERA